VTVLDGEGKRYSLDVQAESSFDAAHLFLTHVRSKPTCGYPIPTTETIFEVVTGGKIHCVAGMRLKAWIEKRRRDWNGPRGFLFNQRPLLGEWGHFKSGHNIKLVDEVYSKHHELLQ
jgi:hypothetical protein